MRFLGFQSIFYILIK